MHGRSEPGPAGAPALRFGLVATFRPRCTSTQELVRAAAAAGGDEGFVAIADHQTAGRGRRGRQWVSQPGWSLLVSILLRPRTPIAELAPLALVAGLAVADALPAPARVRWPNDVVIGGAKVAGILVELEAPAASAPFVVLGVGVNVNVPAAELPPTERLPATSLLVETGVPVDRLALLGALLDRLEPAYRTFEHGGFAAMRDAYAAADGLVGLPIEVALGAETLTGRAAGVDAAGRLVIALDGGGERALRSGEVIHVAGDGGPLR